MPTNKIASGIRFPEVLLRKIILLAKLNHRSLNAQLEFLAENCVCEFEKKHGEIIIGSEDLSK